MTKGQAINGLIDLGCRVIDPCKGKPTVKIQLPSGSTAYGDARDLFSELADKMPTIEPAQPKLIKFQIWFKLDGLNEVWERFARDEESARKSALKAMRREWPLSRFEICSIERLDSTSAS